MQANPEKGSFLLKAQVPPSLRFHFAMTSDVQGRLHRVENWVGFDLDHALVRYNLPALYPLIYDSMVKFLVEQKGYTERLLAVPLDLSLCHKGVIVEWATGNLLTIDEDGFV